MLKWARTNGFAWDEDAGIAAVEGGHLDVLKWLRQNECPSYVIEEAVKACKFGYFEILKWLDESFIKADKYLCEVAAEHGHLSILKWLEKTPVHGMKTRVI